MNANELADHLEKYFDSEPYTSEVTTMLRQQQAEIEELIKHLEFAGIVVEGTRMNANELAEILESDSKHISGRFTYSSRYIADIATMLRQQQAEIDALKAKDLKKSMAIRSLNTQLRKALQYETYSR